jgi:hypothetical protein
MKKYKCIKDMVVNIVGADGFETGESDIVSVGSIWELNNDLNYIGGENHLESEELMWIEIDDNDLKGYFEEV